MSIISAVHAIEILDSRGNPSIECCIELSDGTKGYGQVPSGASTGAHEACELRDDNPKRYYGKGVKKAINQIEEVIAPLIIKQSVFDQESIDAMMIEEDGTTDKSQLGANAILAVSLALADAASHHLRMPLYQYMGGEKLTSLPVPLMNLINGGKHADNSIAIQEFMIVPHAFPTFSEALRAGTEVYHALKKHLKEKGHNTNVGDEGGFAPSFSKHDEALDCLMVAIEAAGYKPGEQIGLALDAASGEFYQDGVYDLNEKKPLDAEGLIERYVDWVNRYPIMSIEDGLHEDDWEGWAKLTQALGEKVQLVGDDLFVTNVGRLSRGTQEHCANAILIKPNQIGTLTETLTCIGIAKKNNFQTVISHRSGETESSFIADLTVATQAGQIKTGAPCRSDRTAKYNRLLRIEYELGKRAILSPWPSKK
jgi:enolase